MDRRSTHTTRQLIDAYIKSAYSPEREAEFARWITDARSDEGKNQTLASLWDRFPVASGRKDAEVQAALDKVRERLGLPVTRKKTLHVGIWARVAAILLLVVGLAGGIYLFNTGKAVPQPVFRELAALRTDDSMIERTLPDNSRLWMNGNSAVSYQEDELENRRVVLDGQARFKVQSKDQSVFEVQTRSIRVRVHGTEFDVREYPGDPTASVALHEGSVQVFYGADSAMLKPGTLFSYIPATGQTQFETLSDYHLDWRYDHLNFRNATLEEVLTGLAAHYGVELVLPPGGASGEISIRFDGTESLEEALYLLEQLAGNFSYQVQETTLVIHSK